MVPKATWIWYPGDYEIWLGNVMNNRRTERGAFFPPFWKQDSHYVTVEFSREVDIPEAETLELEVEGEYNVKVDGKMLFGMPREVVLEAGRHRVNVKVHNQCSPPALFIQGRTVATDPTWKVTFEDKEWIDESGKASDAVSTVYRQAGSWNFDSREARPSTFTPPRRPVSPVGHSGGVWDFGRETFGYVKLHGIAGEGEIAIHYGESREEATDAEGCETQDRLIVRDGTVTDMASGRSEPLEGVHCMSGSKAFRFVNVEARGCTVEGVSMDYEYMPVEARGGFRCSDDELNRIWDVAAYTMELTTREFFVDGIKRDRWVWSGDATQSYLMNYYLFGDNDTVKRTTWLLGGKEPITSHINTILDYTFFWVNSIRDYYMYSGDGAFIRAIYPMMQAYMDFALSRTDADGMAQGLGGDWVFIDWADRPMEKRGQVAFEQVLLARSLETMTMVSELVGDGGAHARYAALAESLKGKLIPWFWDEGRGAIMHGRLDGKLSGDVFRYPNIFAVMYGYLDGEKGERVRDTVFLSGDVPGITTPYMRFYELEALCLLGEHDRVMREIKDYWGGMLREGATTFWEKYDPEERGADRYSMYGRPYGKSLCHAWGASPIYLLGRHFLGVAPTKPGYGEFTVCPRLGGLGWMEGRVPTPFGAIHVRMDGECVTARSDGGKGTLVAGGAAHEMPAGREIKVKL